MRTNAIKKNTLDGMQAWAGQSARLALDISASEIVRKLWEDAKFILE